LDKQKIAEAKLLSFLNEAILEDEEQRQQHMAAIKRFRDDVESKTFFITATAKTNLTPMSQEIVEQEQNLGSINGDTYTLW
jgi:hypothetical protein